MRILFANILLLLFLMIYSCTERIQIETEEEFVRLVVDGSFSTEPMAHKVRLTTTADFFSGRPAPVVTEAGVTISDESVTHILREISPGVYCTLPGVAAEPGHLYVLQINLASPVGGYSEYKAESVAPEPLLLDSIQLRFYPDYSETGMWEARGFFRDPPEFDYYRFMAYRNNVLVTDTLTEWYVTDDFLFGGKYVNGWTVAFLHQHREDESFRAGDTMTIRMDKISREYAGFILGAQSEMRGSWPLFTGPPANVRGNISNGGIGFFAVYGSSRTSVAIGE